MNGTTTNDRDVRQDDNQHDRRERERHAAEHDVKATPAAPVENMGSAPAHQDNRGRGNYSDRKSRNNRREPKNRGVKAEDKVYPDTKG